MGMRYLIDSSAYIRYIDGRLSEIGIQKMDEVLDNNLQMSVIVKMELLSFQDGGMREQIIKEIVNTSEILLLTEEIIDKTIEIRRKTKVKLPDAIIAATAIVNKMTLISCNDSDFLKIPKLKYFSIQ
jgi:predicted nucleic acid-binding protein